MIRPSELNDLLGHTSRDMVERLRRVSFLEHGYFGVEAQASAASGLVDVVRTLGHRVEVAFCHAIVVVYTFVCSVQRIVSTQHIKFAIQWVPRKRCSS